MPAEAKTDRTATRHGYGDALADLGERHDDVVALDADLAVSTQAMKFGKRFPDRFFNVGAAEANMMSMACGLAATGKVPYCSTFAIFAAGRAYDQVRRRLARRGRRVPPDDRGHRADARDAPNDGRGPRGLQPGLPGDGGVV
jgi:transketolase